ncbi:MAG: YggS family pyridoxal phosphate enzyme [Chloroflexi bacterium 44-23]|nr:MAG: YggS family pyridoxal phosphate enzyme [Chloroflexi bacterium 44-23]
MQTPSELELEPINSRFQITQAKIEESCNKISRTCEDVKLIVVTKGQPPEKISAVIKAGAKHIGENYPEETVGKMKEIETGLLQGVSWHMIGHLQSRKIPLLIQGFDYFHALDSLKLAFKLSNRIQVEQLQPIPVLLQYNVSGEEDKYGFQAWDQTRWGDLLDGVNTMRSLPGIHIIGLMTMPPFTQEVGKNRVYFERLRLLRDYLVSQFWSLSLPELSMGTSQDYQDAIFEGATYLRIGTEIMGSRK